MASAPLLVALALMSNSFHESGVEAARANRQTGSLAPAESTFEFLSAAASTFKAKVEPNFSVKKGLMHNFGLEDCNDLVAHGLKCYANNPSSPYGVLMVPPPEGREENFTQCKGEWMPLCDQNSEGEQVSSSFHMEGSEAIVVLGMAPPEMKYFGFVNYLFERTFPDDFEIDKDLGMLSRCWAKDSNDRRCNIFASMGDALNMGNLKAANGEDMIYSQPFAMVITPSQTTFDEMTLLLQQSGLSNVNPLPLPGEFLNLGFEEGTDTFAHLLRTAFPSDSAAYEDWLNKVQEQFIVLRVTPRAAKADMQLYAKPEYCSAGDTIPPTAYCLTPRSKVSEAARVRDISITMDDLRNAQDLILQQFKKEKGWLASLRTKKTGFSAGVPDSGFDCVEKGMLCQGDARDTYYPASVESIKANLMNGIILSQARKKLGFSGLTVEEMAEYKFWRSGQATLEDSPGDSILVVGIMHSATGASEYSSLSVYNLFKLQGIMAFSDSDMKGTAEHYLAGTKYEALSPYLYALEFTRGQCNGRSGCIDLPSTGELSIPLKTPLVFIERMYFDPTTHVGIDPEAAVAAQMIHHAKQF